METTVERTNRIGKSNGTRHVPPVLDAPAPSLDKVVNLAPLEKRFVEVPIVGTTPLIVHNWSEKAVRMILNKQMGVASKGREKKDPFADFLGSLYPIPGGDGYGFPAPAFKACAVSAANGVELKMTQMKQAFHVRFYTIAINAPPHKKGCADWSEWDEKYQDKLKAFHAQGIAMRMDLVRLESGVVDLRFRGWYPTWEANLEVEYNPRMISLEQLVNLIRAGGYGVGVGEWRPGAPKCRSGEYGRFDVKQ